MLSVNTMSALQPCIKVAETNSNISVLCSIWRFFDEVVFDADYECVSSSLLVIGFGQAMPPPPPLHSLCY